MMKKEFEVNDILEAINSINRLKRKKVSMLEVENDFSIKKDEIPLNNQVKSNKSEILVLDEMIE